MGIYKMIGKRKKATLSAMAAGLLFGSACSLGDIRDSVLGGSLAFLEGYTGDLLETWIPAPEEFVGN